MDSRVNFLLANAMIVFIVGCVFYMINTRNIGTPFKDSLTPAQLKIKEGSAKKRSVIYFQGLSLGVILVILKEVLVR
tara:strand:+ start:17661 stop:17891 length:231 start_codon:yes stop_codon:yes gene_type:complete